MVQVNVRVAPELHERLLAAAAQTTVTAVVTEALTAYLGNSQPQGGKGK